jgi:serine/threonine protein kinase
VHGDIAPSNILVGEDGSVCLIDFGLAQQIREPYLAAQDVELNSSAELVKQKSATHISGTPGFTSPEAIRLEPLRFESDIYSWGCIAFYLLSEAMPFEGRTPIEVIWKQKNQPPPKLDSQIENLPRSATQVHSLVRQCMHSRAEDRPHNVLTVRECLTRSLANP